MEATASTSMASTEPKPRPTKDEAKRVLTGLPKKKKSARLKERRLREQARLRKLIAPKHALLAINEIKGVTISNFTYTLAANATPSAPTFISEATINGVAYRGTGGSKAGAKNDICEQAIRDIMLQKMVDQRVNNPENDSTMPDDSFPIVTLVSYAMHKLFGDWESEGFNVPANVTRNNRSMSTAVESSTVASSKAEANSSQMEASQE